MKLYSLEKEWQMKQVRKKIVFLHLFLLLLAAGCGASDKEKEEGSNAENGDAVISYAEVETQLQIEYITSEDGVWTNTVFIYGDETLGNLHEITQLPFPTFWGGEAYSVITPEGDLYLVDGGFQGKDTPRLTEYIEAHGGKVKGWILTHPHVDHIGAFLDYMAANSDKVETVYYSPFTTDFFEKEEDPDIYAVLNNPNAILFYEFLAMKEATEENTEYIPMLTGDKLQLGELELECFYSFDASVRDVNGNSLVFTLTYQDFTLLLTGDMTEATLEKMKATAPESAVLWHADIMQIPHHGYMAGIGSDALYQAVQPEYALLDCTIEEYNGNSVNIQNHVTMVEELGVEVIRSFDSASGNVIRIYCE